MPRLCPYLSATLAAAIFSSLLTACRVEEEPGPVKGVVEASGPAYQVAEEEPGEIVETDLVAVEELSKLQKVFVPMSPASLLSLDEALEEKGYGNVKGSDLKPQFEYLETRFGPALVVYTTTDWLESSSMFQPMSFTQAIEVALEDATARGLLLNPGHPGSRIALEHEQLVQILARLPKQPALPMEIYVTR